MSIEALSSLAAEIQELPANDTDEYNTRLTSFLLEHTELEEGNDFKELTLTQNEEYEVEITNPEGFVLNDLLPEGVKITFSDPELFDDGLDYAALPEIKLIEIPTTFSEEGLSGRLGLAHEVGHIIGPGSPERVKRIQELDSLIESQEDALEKLKLVIEQGNLELEEEVTGWSYGKPFAQVLGVEEERYEHIMDVYLADRVNFTKEAISDVLQDIQDADGGMMLEIYDVSQQDRVSVSLAELRSYVEDVARDSEVSERNIDIADNQYKKIK